MSQYDLVTANVCITTRPSSFKAIDMPKICDVTSSDELERLALDMHEQEVWDRGRWVG